MEFTKEEASEVAGVVDDNGLFATNLREKPLANFLMRVVWIAVGYNLQIQFFSTQIDDLLPGVHKRFSRIVKKRERVEL